MKKNLTISGNPKDIATFIAIATTLGLDIEDIDTKAKTTKESPKETTTKKSSKKTSTKTSSKKKSSDNFDRALYESIAKELGVYGNHGVYKACRPIVYGVMDKSITKAEAKKQVKAWKDSTPWAK